MLTPEEKKCIIDALRVLAALKGKLHELLNKK